MPESACQAHHAVADVTVEREVGRQRDQADFLLQVPDLEPGRAHPDAQRLGLVRAGDRAAIVVRQHHDRSPVQPGVEDALARDGKLLPSSRA